MICSLLGSSVHGILQARILEWIAMPSSSGASRPRDGTWVSCIAGGFFITEPRGKPQGRVYNLSNPTPDLQSSPYLILISVQSLIPVTIQAECGQKVNASSDTSPLPCNPLLHKPWGKGPHKATPPSQRIRFEPLKEVLGLVLAQMFTVPSTLEEKCILGLLHPIFSFFQLPPNILKAPFQLSYNVTSSEKTSMISRTDLPTAPFH